MATSMLNVCPRAGRLFKFDHIFMSMFMIMSILSCVYVVGC